MIELALNIAAFLFIAFVALVAIAVVIGIISWLFDI